MREEAKAKIFSTNSDNAYDESEKRRRNKQNKELAKRVSEYLKRIDYPYPRLKTTKKIKCGYKLGEEKYFLREESEIEVRKYCFELDGYWVKGMVNDSDIIYFKLDRDSMFIFN